MTGRHDKKELPVLTITETLYYYDGPRLALLADSHGRRYLALSVGDADLATATGLSLGFPMIVVPVSDVDWSAYNARERDLRSLFAEISDGQRFACDLSLDQPTLEPVLAGPETIEALLPAAGFWHDVIVTKAMTPGSPEARAHARLA